MAREQSNGETGGANPLGFMPTHWSVVLAAAHANPARRAQALEQLCRSYWEPLYAYIRGRGYEMHDTQDLTQSFFSSLPGLWGRHTYAAGACFSCHGQSVSS